MPGAHHRSPVKPCRLAESLADADLDYPQSSGNLLTAAGG